ncbi:uncharacterized protein ACOB8E_017285 isoform 2-T3 [Sarcophilus harrisii]
MMPFSPPLDFAWIKNGNRGGLGEEREEPTDEETEFQGHYRIYPRLQMTAEFIFLRSKFPNEHHVCFSKCLLCPRTTPVNKPQHRAWRDASDHHLPALFPSRQAWQTSFAPNKDEEIEAMKRKMTCPKS